MTQPRLWQVSIRTTGEGEEAVACLLERAFGQSPSAYRSEKTGAVVVTVYPSDMPGLGRNLRAGLEKALAEMRGYGLDVGKATLTVRPLRRENWAESWKRHFHPISIGRQLLVKPGWSRRRAYPGQRVVILDPGLSFGTGHHPTTLFCLRQLARFHRRGTRQSFLDIGCGSGILAIAATKLGYSPVTAFDNDPEAIRTSRANFKRNKILARPQKVDLTRMPLKARRQYDVICANLIAPLLAKEAEKIANLLKPGGRLVVAGILRREFPEIVTTLQRFGLTLEATGVDKEWKSGQFARAATA